jgi:hypothetical protein
VSWARGAAAVFLSGLACQVVPALIPPPSPPADPNRDVGKVAALDFHGWSAHALENSHTRVVVVPAIGRVMSLGFAGDGGMSDVLWRHGQLGPRLAPDENGWINYGGDKSWPAPQSEWERMVGKGWPPPATFDAVAYTATARDSAIELLSPIDPAYGLRVRRRVSLQNDVTVIDTAYEKVAGAPVRVAVWTITQLVSPERMFALLPARSTFAGGHRSLLPAPPKDLTVDGRLLGLARHPTDKTMIANDAGTLLWVGPGRSLVIETTGTEPSVTPAARPDGVHAQIYTSPDGAEPYVELELLGPLVELAAGQSTAMSVRYRLLRREQTDPTAEARRVFAAELGRTP